MTSWQPNDPNAPQGQPPQGQPPQGQPPQGQPPQGQPPQPPPPGYGPPPAPQYGQPPPAPQYGQPPPAPQYGQPPAPQYGQQPYGGYPAAPAASGYGQQAGMLLPGATRPLRMGDRVIAYIIDVVILAVLSIPYYIGAGKKSGGLIAVGAVLVIAAAIYFIYLTGSGGQTPGKKVMNVKVVDANTGSVIGFGRAFGRQIVQALCNILCYAGLWSAWLDGSSGRYRGWHDKALTTQVISVK